MLVSNALDLTLAEMARAPSNTEPPFRRSVNQVSSRPQVVRKFTVCISRRQRGRSTAVSVFPNHSVDHTILPERVNARRENDQFRTIGQGHARPVDRLVAEPGTVKLMLV